MLEPVFLLERGRRAIDGGEAAEEAKYPTHVQLCMEDKL